MKENSEVNVKLVSDGIDKMEKVMNFVEKINKKKSCIGKSEIMEEEDEIKKNKRVLKKYVMGE